MYSFPIPVVAGRIGPGTQPEEELPLNMLGVPSDMHTFRPPVIDSEAAPEVYRAALDVLRHVLAGMETLTDGAAQRFSMSALDLDPAVLKEVNEMLGQGEVSVLTENLTAQETTFTGLWRVRGAGIDDIEAASFPTALRNFAAARQDTDYLDTMLGRGGVSVLSRGFGNCRITATAYPNVWWVQYFNSMEKLILNSVEVVDVPAVALAAAEDFADSRERLAEWIESLATAL